VALALPEDNYKEFLSKRRINVFSEKYEEILKVIIDDTSKESIDKINDISESFYNSIIKNGYSLAEGLVIFSHCLCLFGKILEKEIGVNVDADFFKTV
jgi:hypothetical protein